MTGASLTAAPPASDRWIGLAGRAPVLALAAAALLAISVKLFLVFTPNEMDAFWIYSWAVNLVDHGIRADRFFYPNDLVGGTYVFSMIPTALIAAVYALMGHGYWTVFVANELWLLLILAAFYGFLRAEFDYRPVTALTMAIVLCLMEPVLRGVVSLRAETLSLAATLIALLCVRRPRLVWLGGALAVLAVEIHATGVIGAGFVALRVLLDRMGLRALVQLALGGVLGMALFWALHPDMVSLRWLHDLGGRQGTNGIRSPLAAYFWHAQYKRHLPELACIGLAGAIMLHARSLPQIWNEAREPILQIVLAVVLLELLGRGSYLYVVWIFVPFYLLALRIRPSALLPLLAFHLASYLALMLYNGDYSHARLAAAIRRVAAPNMLVLGPHPALPGAPTPDQYVWLPEDAEIAPQIRGLSRPVLVVGRTSRPDVTPVDRVGGFSIGWMKSPQGDAR
ncbi:hypothetical protein SR870_10400 [Rhodopseudomonas palustris]|uniref:hypothetical protein n=1 Tax=Rhodopseudomonas palustris TaxID=1076 RepID=UPI002ACD425E|nr:hypothetical protein [Rhodopseudomonas palustris]WQH01650.1 hypothetical protein SR870_10400 [Rhodopseudomonas palustris]